MYQVDIQSKKMNKLKTPTFSELNLKERYDIQEWIDDNPDILGEDLLIIGKEVILNSNIRLDLLAIDRTGSLVIVELKRDFSGSNVDWQAIKYASYCSAFKDDDIVKIYQGYLDKKSITGNAEEEIKSFIADDLSLLNLNKEQRIILVSREFHSDVASAVLWLNEKGLDITCIKIDPFITDNNQLIVYPTKIIPLPEAEEYIKRKAIQRKENAVQQYHPDSISIPDYDDNELEIKLSDFLSQQGLLKERFIVFLKILLSENREFNREEIKKIFFDEYGIGDNVQHAGRLLSNISQAITKKSNDFLRQLIKFGRDSNRVGAHKHSYCIDLKYNYLIQKVINEIE